MLQPNNRKSNIYINTLTEGHVMMRNRKFQFNFIVRVKLHNAKKYSLRIIVISM